MAEGRGVAARVIYRSSARVRVNMFMYIYGATIRRRRRGGRVLLCVINIIIRARSQAAPTIRYARSCCSIIFHISFSFSFFIFSCPSTVWEVTCRVLVRFYIIIYSISISVFLSPSLSLNFFIIIYIRLLYVYIRI